MPYVNQVDAALAHARGLLAQARERADVWPHCGKVLARAFEFAASAVLIAWGDPRKADTKIHDSFNDRVAPLIDPQHAYVVETVWRSESEARPPDVIAPLLAACERAIEYLATLAKDAPLAGWKKPSMPESVGWYELPEDMRTFLRDIQACARNWSPGVRIVLFGSRAANRARPDSDYDLFLIFPDDIPEQYQRLSRGDVIMLGRDRGLALDIESATAHTWEDPDQASAPLVHRVRMCGVEVPE